MTHGLFAKDEYGRTILPTKSDSLDMGDYWEQVVTYRKRGIEDATFDEKARKIVSEMPIQEITLILKGESEPEEQDIDKLIRELSL